MYNIESLKITLKSHEHVLFFSLKKFRFSKNMKTYFRAENKGQRKLNGRECKFNTIYQQNRQGYPLESIMIFISVWAFKLLKLYTKNWA